MYAAPANDKQAPKLLDMHTVLKLTKYVTSMINNPEKGETRILLILEMEVLHPGPVVGKILGSPVPLTDADSGTKTTSVKESNTRYGGSTMGINEASSRNGTELSTSVSGMGSQSLSSQLTNPISSLSPYHNKWVIKARVMNKGPIRTWSNSRGEGKLFSLDLVDESGEIRCTAFKEMVDKYYDIIQVDKVYYISKCQLKIANKQYSNLRNDYEMSMTNETIVEECLEDDGRVPKAKYDFVTIDKIAQMEVGSIVDVIGVCKSATELQTIMTRTDRRELSKRDVTLVDQSKCGILLTLWGSEAQTFDASNNPVVVVKQAKITEFGGKKLTASASSNIKINPDIKECYKIKGWYDLDGHQVTIDNVSLRGGGGSMGGMGSVNTPWMTFREVQEANLGTSERGDYYQLIGTILLMRHENSIYKACPTEECNKKVIDVGNGMYRCEKCAREYPNFKYRLLASMNVGDWTGNQWVNLFHNEAEKILGVTAQDVGMALETNSEEANKYFDAANFKTFLFRFRTKMETYNDESRLKTVVVKVDAVNYEEHNAYLVEKINEMKT